VEKNSKTRGAFEVAKDLVCSLMMCGGGGGHKMTKSVDEMNKLRSHHVVVATPCRETSIIWFWLKVVLDNKIDFILGIEHY